MDKTSSPKTYWFTFGLNCAATVVLFLCSTIMAGWLNHSYRLLHLGLSLAAMQFNTALCFALFCMALLTLRSAPNFSLGACIFALAITFVTLLQYALGRTIGIDTFFVIPFDVDYNINMPGRMAASTALGFALAGIAIIALVKKEALTDRRSLAITLMGSLVITTGMVPMLGHVFDLRSAYDSGHFVHMSVYAAFCFIILGLLIAAYASTKTESFNYGLPAFSFICITFAMYFVSEAVNQQQEVIFDSLLESQVNTITHEADQHLSNFYRAIDRIANRWQDTPGGTSYDSWVGDANAYLRDYPFLSALSITDTEYHVKWIRPDSDITRKAKGFQITSEPMRAEAVKQAIAKHMGQTTKIVQLFSGNNGYLYVVPLYNKTQFQGMLTAGLHVHEIFDEILVSQNIRNFYVTVDEEQKHVFSTLPHGQEHLKRWQKIGIIHNKNNTWLVTLSPTPEFIDASNSRMPLILMVAGIFIATLVMISIIFMLKWRYNAETLRLREVSLQEALQLNDAILAAASHLIIATDTNGFVIEFNNEAERALGYMKSEILGKHTPALWHDKKEIFKRSLELSSEYGETIQPGLGVFSKKPLINGLEKSEWTFIRKNGSTFSGEMTVTVLKNSTGQINGYLSIIQDISQRKEIERIKNEFISTVSHELRTPLTSIRGSLDLVLGGIGGTLSDKTKSLIDIAHKNCERLVLLINDILDLEKIEAGQMHFNSQPENLKNIIEHSIELNRSYGEKYNVNFILKEPLYAATVTVDSDRLLQVLSNLLSNAAKFSPPQSAVEITIVQHEQMARVSVTDYGNGIPEDFKKRIFQKFAQADSSDTRQKGGTGLGLTIARTIMEKMGGSIGFTTEAGKGTTFYFDLPSMTSQPKPSITIARKISDRPRILICEDDHDIAHLLSITFDKEGYDCDLAYSAAMAHEFLATGTHYTAMTLDIILPDQDGLSLLSQLREQEATRKLPVIIVSAKAEEISGTLRDQYAVGLVDYLKKPIDTGRLIQAVSSVAKRKDKPSILHVEDDEDTAAVLALSLKDIATFTHAMTLEEARKLLQEKVFDLIILDLALPDGSGLEVISILKQNGSSVPIIIFSAHDVSHYISQKVAAILTKSKSTNDHIVSTIKTLISKMNGNV